MRGNNPFFSSSVLRERSLTFIHIIIFVNLRWGKNVSVVSNVRSTCGERSSVLGSKFGHADFILGVRMLFARAYSNGMRNLGRKSRTFSPGTVNRSVTLCAGLACTRISRLHVAAWRFIFESPVARYLRRVTRPFFRLASLPSRA